MAKRLALRVVLVYWLFEWAPLGPSLLTSSLTAGLLPDPNWWASLNDAVGTWLVAHVLRFPPHSPARLSANYLPLPIGNLAILIVSALVAIAWTARNRQQGDEPRLFVWLHTATRIELAAIMLWYGWAKVLPEQFFGSLDYLAVEVAQHNPRDLLWAFMSGSRGYQIFTGLVEVAGGLCLLSRRTAMFGAVLVLGSMANVVALDIAYDVPVKFLACEIFLMSLLVLAPYATRLVGSFNLGRTLRPVELPPLLRSASGDRRLRVVGAVFAVWIAWATFQNSSQDVARINLSLQTPLYGIWDMEAMSRNDVSVPLVATDPTLWRRLIVQAKDAAVIVPMTDPPSQAAWTGHSILIPCTVRFDSALQKVDFVWARQHHEFTYALPVPDQLVLTSRDSAGGTTVLRLRRLNVSAYPLMNWERHWRW